MINPGAELVDGAVWIFCEHCGKYTEVQRQSAAFCNGKCKNAFHNQKRKRAKDITLALHSLETLIANMPLKGDSEEWATLIQMQEMIKAAMWRVET